MPRQPRPDAPGALLHVMGRGIAKAKIFQSDKLLQNLPLPRPRFRGHLRVERGFPVLLAR